MCGAGWRTGGPGTLEPPCPPHPQLPQSLFERQGLPGPEKLPGSLRKGIPRTKSVGMAGLGAARGREEWDRGGCGAGRPCRSPPFKWGFQFPSDSALPGPSLGISFVDVCGCQSFTRPRGTLWKETLEAPAPLHCSPSSGCLLPVSPTDASIPIPGSSVPYPGCSLCSLSTSQISDPKTSLPLKLLQVLPSFFAFTSNFLQKSPLLAGWLLPSTSPSAWETLALSIPKNEIAHTRVTSVFLPVDARPALLSPISTGI